MSWGFFSSQNQYHQVHIETRLDLLSVWTIKLQNIAYFTLLAWINKFHIEILYTLKKVWFTYLYILSWNLFYWCHDLLTTGETLHGHCWLYLEKTNSPHWAKWAMGYDYLVLHTRKKKRKKRKKEKKKKKGVTKSKITCNKLYASN